MTLREPVTRRGLLPSKAEDARDDEIGIDGSGHDQSLVSIGASVAGGS